MKKLLAATICTVPFAFGGSVYAQVDPSIVNAAPQSQGDTSRHGQDAGSGQQDQSAAGSEGSTGAGTTSSSSDAGTQDSSVADTNGSDTSVRTGTSETDTATPGSPDSMTSVTPTGPATPSTTEPGQGQNRSSSGDATETQPRAQDGQGAR